MTLFTYWLRKRDE
ncbi:hypothetical protein BUZ11_08400 [Staphylococcus gallinarum]|nr:hypothetical protein [Staphylococcus gallinarum]MCD8871829.1 hypothetical protein [Staphylococcus gallinarum]PTL09382.1 hypothetical protein BUZ15_09160 [Staphylococcus gallinarum]PTL12450.1 hypothetical protein BUZ09_00970 [Staphylococcus gallinarum]RIL28151.1 hypothetical protein BUY98_13915 [Staphylococcus gallinarum]